MAVALVLGLAWTPAAVARGADGVPTAVDASSVASGGVQESFQRRRPVPWWRRPVAKITDRASLIRAWSAANNRQRRIATKADRALGRAQRADGAAETAALRNATLWLRRYAVQRRALRKAARAAAAASEEQSPEGRELGRLQTCLAHVVRHERLLRDHGRALARWRASISRDNARRTRNQRVASRRFAARLARNRRTVVVCARSARNNLTANPSFELGISWWSAFNADLARRRDPSAPHGDWVGRVTRSEGDVYTLDDLGASVGSAEVGAIYEARAFVKAAAPTAVGKPIRIVIRETTPEGLIRQIRGPEVPLSDDYQLLSVPATDQDAGAALEVFIVQLNATPGDGFLVDRVRMRSFAPAGEVP
ncbi:MAG: hypothetical protein ACR2N6_04300 [Miltoncostaeaceae bacterium]